MCTTSSFSGGSSSTIARAAASVPRRTSTTLPTNARRCSTRWPHLSGDAPAGDPARAMDVVQPTRPAKTFSDMGRSLGLMAVVIAVLLLIGPARTLIFPGSAKVQPVDYSHRVTAFKNVVGIVLAPTDLPRGWRANAATFGSARGRAHLHIGFATPGSLFAGVDESNGPPAQLLSGVLGPRGTTVTGTTTIAGETWETRRSQRGEQALTVTRGPLTVVVTGSATERQLRTLAGSLR